MPSFRLLRNNRSKALALVTALWSADSLITLGASTLPLGCEVSGKACGDVGCRFPPVTIHVPAAPALPMGETLTVTLCLDDACLSGQFSLDNADASVPGSSRFTIPTNYVHADSDHADITIERYSGISIQYYPSSSNALTDGDHYTVTIENGVGETLLTKETTVTYSKSYPNGPDCDQQPCLQADVTL